MKLLCSLFATIMLGCFAAIAQPSVVSAPSGDVRIAAAVKVLPNCPTDSSSWSNPNAAQLEVVPLLPLIASTAEPLVEPVIEAGIGLFVQWMKEREAALSATSSARDLSTLYIQQQSGAQARSGCLVFVRGEFGNNEVFAQRQPNNHDNFWTNQRLQLLRRGFEDKSAASDTQSQVRGRIGQINLVAPPLVYAELPIKFDDRSAARSMALSMGFLDYRATAAERTGSGRKDLLFSFVLEQPTLDTSGGSRVFARFDLALQQVAIGSRFSAPTLSDKVSTFQPLPSAKTAQGKFDAVPFSVLGTLAETEKAGDLELAASQLIEKNRSTAASSAANLVKKAAQQRESLGQTASPK